MLTVELKDGGRELAGLVLKPKEFRTGSRGYFGTAKATINGKKFQFQCQLVEVGSKPVPVPSVPMVMP